MYVWCCLGVCFDDTLCVHMGIFMCVRVNSKLLNGPSAAGLAELAYFKDSLTDTQPAGALVGLTNKDLLCYHACHHGLWLNRPECCCVELGIVCCWCVQLALHVAFVQHTHREARNASWAFHHTPVSAA
jgi:hypothetical protein